MNKKLFSTLLVLSLLVVSSLCQDGAYQDYDFQPEKNDVDKLVYSTILGKVSQQNDQLTFDSVESCKVQVVAGINYQILLNFKDIQGKIVQYFFQIYVIPWENSVQIIDMKQYDPESTNLTQNFELQQQIKNFLDSQVRLRVNTDLTDYKLTNLKVISQQIVSGNIYNVVVSFQKDEDVKSFEVTVWSRLWINPPFEIKSIKDFKDQVEETVQSQKFLRQESPATGLFEKVDWNPQGQMEQSIISALQQRNQDITEIKVKDVRIQALANPIINIKFAYKFQGEKKFVSASLKYNPVSSISTVVSYDEIDRKKQLKGQPGSFQPYQWQDNGEVEQKIISTLKTYYEAKSNSDFKFVQVGNPQIKVVNGLIFSFGLIYETQGNTNSAQVQFYAQTWSNTYQVLSFENSISQ